MQVNRQSQVQPQRVYSGDTGEPHRKLTNTEKEAEMQKIVSIITENNLTSDNVRLKLKDMSEAYGKVINKLIDSGDEQLITELFDEALRICVSRENNRISPSVIDAVIKQDMDLMFAHAVKESIENPRLEAANRYFEEKTNEIRTSLVKSDGPISIPRVVIGAGDAATQFWLDSPDTPEAKKQQELPKTVLFANDTGNWKHTYTLAQRHSTLERSGSPSNPLAYAGMGDYEADRHVDASCLYKSNLVNLTETKAPVCLGTAILQVERKDKKYEGDWEVGDAPNRVNMKLEVSKREEGRNLIISDASIANLFKELELNDEKNLGELLDILLAASGVDGKSLANNEKIKKLSGVLSTDAILKIAKDKGNFESWQKQIGLQPKINQIKFAQTLQFFLRSVAADTLQEQLKLSSTEPCVLAFSFNPEKDKKYTEIKLVTDAKGIPQVEGGKVNIEFKSCQNKYIYTKELHLCTGFGVARQITTGDDIRDINKPVIKQISPEDSIRLGQYDANLGFTPVVDGNTFMLTGREEGGPKRDVIIYGGGGNATACFRKSFFDTDEKTEMKAYDTEHQKNKVTWFARTGFEESGYGKLAKDALTYALDERMAFCGELVRVESLPSGRVAVYMRDTEGTYQDKLVNPPDDKGFPNQLTEFTLDPSGDPNAPKAVKMPVRRFECDQFVYTIGQEKKPITGLFSGFDANKGDSKIMLDPNSGMPLGVESEDGSMKFWGATALVFTPSQKATVESRKKDVERVINEIVDAQDKADERYQKAALKVVRTENPQEKDLAVDEFAKASLEKYKTDLLVYKAMEYENRLKLTMAKANINQDDWAYIFSENLRDWITVQRIARDAEWPGVMPPSRVSSRQTAFVQKTGSLEFGQTRDRLLGIKMKMDEELNEFAKLSVMNKKLSEEINELKAKDSAVPNEILEAQNTMGENLLGKAQILKQLQTEKEVIQEKFNSLLVNWPGTYAEAVGEFEHANINLDDIDYLNGVLLNAGVSDTTVRMAFLARVLKERAKAHSRGDFPGISGTMLKIMIEDYGLQDNIEIIGKTTLKVKTPAQKESVKTAFERQIQ